MSNQVQTLLQAEKEASTVVAKARQYRIQRLKDARAEATKEIDSLKARKNEEFIDYEKKFVGDEGEGVKKAEKETEIALEIIKKLYEERKGLVVDKLLDTVAKCNPEIHLNAKPMTGNSKSG